MAGFYDFTAGQVLSAAFVDSYLMQQAIIADTSAPTASHEGMMWFDQTENRLKIYNGTSWIRTSIWSAANGRTGVYCSRTANQSIPDSTATNVSFDTEGYDSDAYIATTSTTVTIPSGLGGLYTVSANCIWSASPIGGSALSYLQVTSGGDIERSDSIGTRNSVAQTLALDAGDSITVAVWQSTGGAINITDCRLRAWRLGP